MITNATPMNMTECPFLRDDCPIENSLSMVVPKRDSETIRQIEILRQELREKEREILRKNEEVLSLKMEREREKMRFVQGKNLEQHMIEYKHNMVSHKDLALLRLTEAQLPEKVVIYQENTSEIAYLQDLLAEKNTQIMDLSSRLLELEQHSVEMNSKLGNSHKAQMIIHSELWASKERELLLFQSKLLESNKRQYEDYLNLQISYNALKEKKTRIKRILKEIESYYEKETVSFKRAIETLESEVHEVLKRTYGLEEELGITLKELEQERREKNTFKYKFEEVLRQIKEMKNGKSDGSLRNVEVFCEKMQRNIEDSIRKCEEKNLKQEICSCPVQNMMLPMPNMMPMQNVMFPMQSGHIHTSCTKENNNTLTLEHTLRELKSSYQTLKHDIKHMLHQQQTNQKMIEICVVSTQEFLESSEFKDFLLDLSSKFTDFKDVQALISIVSLNKEAIYIHNFKTLDFPFEKASDYLHGKNLKDLSWSDRSQKFLILFYKNSDLFSQISTFISSNSHFIERSAFKIFSFGFQPLETWNFEFETLAFEDLKRLPGILEDLTNI